MLQSTYHKKSLVLKKQRRLHLFEARDIYECGLMGLELYIGALFEVYIADDNFRALFETQ